jgi:hypothetical protein
METRGSSHADLPVETLSKSVLCVGSWVTGLGEFSPLGRIFASWTNVYFDQFLLNLRVRPNFWELLLHRKSCLLISTKICLGSVWGGFFSHYHLATMIGRDVSYVRKNAFRRRFLF